MKFIVKEIKDKEEKEKISKEVLYDLPEWFGMPESTEEYITDSQDKPFLASFYQDEIVGFIVLNTTSPDCADIFVMGIKKKFHRQGAATQLNEAYEKLAKKLGYIYSQVKTVQSGHYKEYDITNSFYTSVGYKELEVFPTLWDEWNPCQIYIKYLGD
ncbi:GNAT family N-acetyltransferase [Granulicatella sp. zg-ZJ]|uniref:GNAT family N-acetyltransferase n=1 Tax=unclassified Granulicatella TaxID=2630493 RepID=UPI0013C289E1|nr:MULTISPECIES: GNAT family N-acetyltransferase [unclassified Granulicatella]MBS4749997.1 GNAT family N-acetyltransferase [Carnobacteriaceae bacterium zg-ZUI78]NEW63079.1 GNAT family N-acetyltransferase [Granulicatella sp. zg-ZJ]NEW66195.1 GNAT family N-acetyltransferase [Granulicatella sp. zg-84]QMI86049.1 GNAT family N-acetyltransferase [Carnobacteriaceae bacterium zg-84]